MPSYNFPYWLNFDYCEKKPLLMSAPASFVRHEQRAETINLWTAKTPWFTVFNTSGCHWLAPLLCVIDCGEANRFVSWIINKWQRTEGPDSHNFRFMFPQERWMNICHLWYVIELIHPNQAWWIVLSDLIGKWGDGGHFQWWQIILHHQKVPSLHG